MQKTFRYILAILFFGLAFITEAQKQSPISNQGSCKLLVFSKFRNALSLYVFYFSQNNIRIRSTSGYPHVNACHQLSGDTIKTVAFWSEGYFLQVIKIDNSVVRDTVFLPQVANQAVSKIEGLVFDAQGALNVVESKVAVSEYIRFIHREKAFTFRISVGENNAEDLRKANAFYKELLKTDQGLKLKLSIESSSDPNLAKGIYLKAFALR
jgi:hypothetical protein